MRVFLLTKTPNSECTKTRIPPARWLCSDAVVYLAGDGVYNLMGEHEARD